MMAENMENKDRNGKKKRKKEKRWIIPLIILGVVGAGVFAASQMKKETVSSRNEAAVQTARVPRMDLSSELSA